MDNLTNYSISEYSETGDLPSGAMSYINDNSMIHPSWNIASSCQKIEDLNYFQNIDKNTQGIINIHKELMDSTEDTNQETWGKVEYKGDTDVVDHLAIIDSGSLSFEKTMIKCREHFETTLISEKEYKTSYDKLQSDINKVSEFKEFAVMINHKYKDLEIEKINGSILELSTRIKENNNIEELKKKYLKNNYIRNCYLRFIQRINGCNNGSTCSICLQRQVDTFMEPCGHTGCSECIEKLKERNGEYCNCYVCRKSIIKFHKLYFV